MSILPPTTQNEIATIQAKSASSLTALVETQGLDRNPAAVYLASLSESGRRTMRQALDVIAGILTGNADCLACDWAGLRFQHTTVVRTRLVESYAPATARKMLCALRGALKAAWRLGLVPAEEYHRARDLEKVNGETLPAGRELQAGEISGLMGVCEDDPTPAGARDAALIALLYSCGLRREESVSLDLENYDPDSGLLEVLHAKRGKQRTAYLVNGAARAMADWLALRGDELGPLFWPINKGGKLANRRMSTQAVYNMLAKRGCEAGVKNFSPHDFRRTFVSDLLEAGADISVVARMAGHASVTTTARYDRRPEEAKRRAATLLHVPYRGRLF